MCIQTLNKRIKVSISIFYFTVHFLFDRYFWFTTKISTFCLIDLTKYRLNISGVPKLAVIGVTEFFVVFKILVNLNYVVQ